MARIRLLRSGLNVAGATRSRGDVVDVERAVADYLVPSGQAELVRETAVEVAVSGPSETTSRSRTRRPSGRGK